MVLRKIHMIVLILMVSNTLMASNIWGFWAHKRINRMAVFRLPPEMMGFYKSNIDYITENAVNPDKRRYAVVGEAERHYIDLDVYGDSALVILPKYWSTAIEKFGEDSLRKHGIVPWYIQTAAFQLTEAFRTNNSPKILRISADLGHYIADSHVPLHTTKNYNGQLTRQDGIHGFWESRLPELYGDNYDLWIGNADYIENIPKAIWGTVEASHIACDSVLVFERKLSEEFSEDKKFSFDLRNNILTKSYSTEFSKKFEQMLDGQVEKRMRASIKMVADMWYTCWVNAGQPKLTQMNSASKTDFKIEEAEAEKNWLQRLLKVRNESDF